MRLVAATISFAIFVISACGDGGGDAPLDPDCLGKCDSVAEPDYEFIVVGSGAGGGPLAANLAREGFRVLLLEAGDYAGDNLTYQVPALHPMASEDPELSWSYMVDHYDDPTIAERDTKMVYDETGGQRGILYPRGSTVGGSTAVNAMIFIAPHDSDWDRVADLTGDETFRPDAMRPYFMNVEANRYLDTTSALRGHGQNGWLSVETADPWLALRDFNILHVVTSAASQAGDGFFGTPTELVGLMRRDLNAYTPERDNLEGVFMIPTATQDGQRNGTREFLLDTIARGFPLTLQTKALVTNVVFADEPDADGRPRAIGVEYVSGQNLYRADVESGAAEAPSDPVRVLASREVVLSAGAFNTPQLLMLSGIGPRAELEANGIPVRVELPGVGQNLQDRYEVGIVTEADEDYALLSDCTFQTSSSDPCYREWETGGGPYTTNGGVVGIVRRSSVALTDPDLFIFGLPGFFKGYYPGYSRDVGQSKRLLTWAILKGHTRNRAGSVGLRSADPLDQPAIDFAYFAEGGDDDLEAMIDGVEFVRDIIDDTDDLLLGVDEVWPGPEVSTRESIGQWVRDEAWGHHASCTAKMGGDDDGMAVLDSHFRVRGVAGLRVVDASVFPEIPGFFIVVPVYMMSEKASATIIDDTRRGMP